MPVRTSKKTFRLSQMKNEIAHTIINFNDHLFFSRKQPSINTAPILTMLDRPSLGGGGVRSAGQGTLHSLPQSGVRVVRY